MMKLKYLNIFILNYKKIESENNRGSIYKKKALKSFNLIIEQNKLI